MCCHNRDGGGGDAGLLASGRGMTHLWGRSAADGTRTADRGWQCVPRLSRGTRCLQRTCGSGRTVRQGRESQTMLFLCRFLYRNLKGYRLLLILAIFVTMAQVGSDLAAAFP